MSDRRRLLRGVSRIVPAPRRADWLREWEAELAHAGNGRRLGLRRGVHAIEDALRLRLRSVGGLGVAASLAAIAQDAGYALRALRHRPGYVVAAGLPLALGIGANAAIFSVISGVLFHPLPYQDPGRLVLVNQ